MKQETHKWNFFTAGGTPQPKIENAEDLRAIASLDCKFWATLACPVEGVDIDKRTLTILDSDSDGRIRREEVVAACEWVCSVLKDANSVFDSNENLPLANIDDSSACGARILAASKRVLQALGKSDAMFISPADFAKPEVIFKDSIFNADGVIVPTSSSDEKLSALIKDIVAVKGSKSDRSGEAGVDAGLVSAFFDELSAWNAWRAEGGDASILDAADAFSAFKLVEEKIDDFFVRANVLKYDSDALDSVNPSAEKLAEILSKPISESEQELARLPISRVVSPCLVLGENINPAWKSAMEDFSNLVVKAALGEVKSEISAEQWAKIKAFFARRQAWLAKKPATAIEGLGEVRIAEISALENARADLEGLIAQDSSATEFDGVEDAEKLVRFNAYLAKFLENFVNFKRFYTTTDGAFECGKLCIDRRVCELCIPVADSVRHAKFAPFGGMYMLYCLCKRKGEADRQIAAAVTAGDCDNLMVGRNGVFYDKNGKDWDATVTAIVANPISVSQAFFSPYKRFSNWLTTQISKRAAAADKSMGEEISKSATDPKKKVDVGTVAALGVAVSGLTAAFGLIIDKIFNLGMWLPLGIVGIILAISLPSMILAAIKLRARNLAPILDANGWAVNASAKIGFPLGAKLTETTLKSSSMLRNCLIFVAFLLIGCGVAFWASSKIKAEKEKPVATAQADAVQLKAGQVKTEQVKVPAPTSATPPPEPAKK